MLFEIFIKFLYYGIYLHIPVPPLVSSHASAPDTPSDDVRKTRDGKKEEWDIRTDTIYAHKQWK